MKVPDIRHERITAAALFVLSVAYTLGGLRIKLGQMANPGPGLMPLIVGCLLTICTAVYLARTMLLKPDDMGSPRRDQAPRPKQIVPLCIGGLVVLYPFLLWALGFILSTFLTVWWILALLRYKRILVSGALAAVIAIALFFLFSMLLSVVLPGGELETFFMNL